MVSKLSKVWSLTNFLKILQYLFEMKYWIFDFDGTLVDTDGLFSACLKHVMEPFKVDVGPHFMEEIRHKHPHRIFEDLLDPVQAEEAMKRMRTVGQELSKGIRAFPGIEEVLNTLEKSKMGLAIWTGRDGESTRRILKQLNLFDRFEHIISGTCVETNKPGHDGLLELRGHFDSKEDQMIMVGDHHHDIEPANHLGLYSVHARWKNNPHALPENVVPDFSFDSTEKFHQWVRDKIK